MWSRLQLFELHYQVGLNRQSKVAWHQMRRLQVEDYQVVEVEMGKEEVRKEKRRRREEGEKGEEGGGGGGGGGGSGEGKGMPGGGFL